MERITNVSSYDFESLQVDEFWNVGDEKELKVHRIHAYPAKFPAFITTKALEYAQTHKLKVDSIADIFCGCGTTAFEAKRNNKAFWGCDINPVATMIAKVKSRKYQTKRLQSYLENILDSYKKTKKTLTYGSANPRLKYWYKRKQFNDLTHLKETILTCTPGGSDYQLFFICAFSNILKKTSVWLTKSIKPQVDPEKNPSDVITSFVEQCTYMLLANDEIQDLNTTKSIVKNINFLSNKVAPDTVDMIITSPPYVTSYEYADLHQLSSLWLGYTDDYKKLREGSIGSLHHDYNFTREWKYLNNTGMKIVSLLLDKFKSKAKSVTKYFLDMQNVAIKSYDMLNDKGIALFVIGNTEYKDVRVDNAKHLAESLYEAGFSEVLATKRKISKKILTPFRDERGKFSTNSSGRKIYSEEFIVVGLK